MRVKLTSAEGTKPLTNQGKEKVESEEEDADGFQQSRPDHCVVKEEERGPDFCINLSKKRSGEDSHSSIKL